MNELVQWFTSPEWTCLAKALMHSLWQGALVAACVAFVFRRTTSPVIRYRLGLAGLGVVVAATIITWGILSAPLASTATRITVAGPVAGGLGAAASPVPWTAWLSIVWFMGACSMLGRTSLKVAGAERLRRTCRELDDPLIADLVAEARRAVRLTRRVRVAVTERLTSPAVVGIIVPTLILPLTLVTSLGPEQIRFILLHELAHIRRGDYLANLLQLLAEALLFFNPAVWWISHQVRREREACCDALAIRLSDAPADYARTLVCVAEASIHSTPSAAVSFGDRFAPSSLMDRIQRLLVPGYHPPSRLTWRAILAALFLAGALLGLLAAGTRKTVAATARLIAVGGENTEMISNTTDLPKASSGVVLHDGNSTIMIDPSSSSGMFVWSLDPMDPTSGSPARLASEAARTVTAAGARDQVRGRSGKDSPRLFVRLPEVGEPQQVFHQYYWHRVVSEADYLLTNWLWYRIGPTGDIVFNVPEGLQSSQTTKQQRVERPWPVMLNDGNGLRIFHDPTFGLVDDGVRLHEQWFWYRVGAGERPAGDTPSKELTNPVPHGRAESWVQGMFKTPTGRVIAPGFTLFDVNSNADIDADQRSLMHLTEQAEWRNELTPRALWTSVPTNGMDVPTGDRDATTRPSEP